MAQKNQLHIIIKIYSPDDGDLDIDVPTPNIVVGKAKIYLFDIFKEYKTIYGNQGTSSGDLDTSTISSGRVDPIGRRLQNFYDARSQKRSIGPSSNPCIELETYLTTNFKCTDSFDLSKWQSRRTTNFHIVSIIAKEILDCPASTVSVEQTFSV